MASCSKYGALGSLSLMLSETDLNRSSMPSLNSSFPMAAVTLGLLGGRDGK